MKLEIITTSIVLVGVGQTYSPSSIDQQFLLSNKISKKNWVLAETPHRNPVFSRHVYTNGLAFIVAPDRFEVSDLSPQGSKSIEKLVKIWSILVDKISYARHLGVGINFTAFIETDNGFDILKDTFMKDGAWVKDSANALSITFSYPISKFNSTLNLTYGVVTRNIPTQDTPQKGIGLSANFHRDIDSKITLDAASREVKEQLNNATNCEDLFKSKISEALGIGHKHEQE